MVFNYHVDAVLCVLFIAVVVLTAVFGARAAFAAHRAHAPTTRETEYVSIDSVAAGAAR